MKMKTWKTWEDIFAWQDDSGLYANTLVFGVAIDYYAINEFPEKSQRWTEETPLFKVLSNESFTIRSYRPSIVHLGSDCYAEIDLCAMCLEAEAKTTDHDPQESDRLWYNNCASELRRIMYQFPKGIPAQIPIENIFTDAFYLQYYEYLKSAYGKWRDEKYGKFPDRLAELRPDLFAVENKIEVDTGGRTGEKDVYFIQGCLTQRIKIGISHDVNSRLKGIESSEALRLLAVIKQGGEDLERRLHKKFHDLHIQGEWFSPDPELLEYIGELTP